MPADVDIIHSGFEIGPIQWEMLEGHSLEATYYDTVQEALEDLTKKHKLKDNWEYIEKMIIETKEYDVCDIVNAIDKYLPPKQGNVKEASPIPHLWIMNSYASGSKERTTRNFYKLPLEYYRGVLHYRDTIVILKEMPVEYVQRLLNKDLRVRNSAYANCDQYIVLMIAPLFHERDQGSSPRNLSWIKPSTLQVIKETMIPDLTLPIPQSDLLNGYMHMSDLACKLYSILGTYQRENVHKYSYMPKVIRAYPNDTFMVLIMRDHFELAHLPFIVDPYYFATDLEYRSMILYCVGDIPPRSSDFVTRGQALLASVREVEYVWENHQVFNEANELTFKAKQYEPNFRKWAVHDPRSTQTERQSFNARWDILVTEAMNWLDKHAEDENKVPTDQVVYRWRNGKYPNVRYTRPLGIHMVNLSGYWYMTPDVVDLLLYAGDSKHCEEVVDTTNPWYIMRWARFEEELDRTVYYKEAPFYRLFENSTSDALMDMYREFQRVKKLGFTSANNKRYYNYLFNNGGV